VSDPSGYGKRARSFRVVAAETYFGESGGQRIKLRKEEQDHCSTARLYKSICKSLDILEAPLDNVYDYGQEE
jgi:hypothetical protein